MLQPEKIIAVTARRKTQKTLQGAMVIPQKQFFVGFP
jgi:hypothetical protein